MRVYKRALTASEVSSLPGGGLSSPNINWLVADQPGTLRMVFDKTGSLATTKRHDYLPFGEELFAGQGGRTIALGYTADNTRQQFTSKERDNETGLDYFGARYYASTQGRFTSVDPIQVTPERMIDPQQFNLYSYCRNNPLKYVDPDGEDNEATDFKKFEELSKKQQELLKSYFNTTDNKTASENWTSFTQQHNAEAATFLAVTNALSKTTLELGGGKTVNALDMVKGVTSLEEQRIKVTLDKDSFNQWKDEGKGGFSIANADGTTQTGHVKFTTHSDGFGSVHEGYDMQGYTSKTMDFPRIQWNYRKSDSNADIDLDGYKPWLDMRHKFGGKNSDVRQWYNSYVGKYGNAGFNVRKKKS